MQPVLQEYSQAFQTMSLRYSAEEHDQKRKKESKVSWSAAYSWHSNSKWPLPHSAHQIKTLYPALQGVQSSEGPLPCVQQ
eukprot:Gb_02055 [translate_table: standard]